MSLTYSTDEIAELSPEEINNRRDQRDVRLRVLYVNYLFDRQYSSVGAAVHVKEFVQAAREAGVEVISRDLNKFGSEAAAVQSPLRAWLKRKLARYLGQLNALLSNVGYFKREWKLVSQEEPDALLVRYNLLNFSMPLIARLKGIPLVLEVNSPMALESRRFNTTHWNLPLILEWTERINLRLASKVYTVSEALKAYFVEQGIDANKISVIPNGVNVSKFNPDVSGKAIRAQYGLGDSVVLGFIGSFHYWHGVESLPPYIEQLCAKYPQVNFLLVGNGPLREKLEATMRQSGLQDRVVFAGYVEHSEIPKYLAAMDIVLAPYPAMTFFYFSPLKLFEYMAAGKPVVASRVGQIEEIVEDGANGLLYEAGDMAHLIARSCQLIESRELRGRIGQQARELMCNRYSWQVNAGRVMALVQKALQERGQKRETR